MKCAECNKDCSTGVYFKPWVCSQHVGEVKDQFRCSSCEEIRLEKEKQPQETIDLGLIMYWHCNAISYDIVDLPNGRVSIGETTNCKSRNEKVLCRGCAREQEIKDKGDVRGLWREVSKDKYALSLLEVKRKEKNLGLEEALRVHGDPRTWPEYTA